jgi:RHS repeat-associated protein
MKHLRNLLLLATIAILSLLAAQAQRCYTPVPSFQGSYSLTGTGSGACTGDSQGACTTNLSVSGNTITTDAGASCSLAGWGGDDPNLSLSFDVTKVDPCTPSGQSSDTFVGTSPALAGSGWAITVSPSNGTFTFLGAAIGSGTLTTIDCNGNETTSPLPGFPLYPGSNWPQTFSLSNPAQTLDMGNWSFQGTGTVQTDSWTLSFSDNPNYNPDDNCKQDGHSTIGCQTQSLGEDVPIVGTGFKLHYESGRAPGAPGDAVATADAAMLGGWTLTVHHAYDAATNTLFLGDGNQRNGYQLGTPVSFNSNLLLSSEDGSEVYVFSSKGEHLQTVRPLTGALVYQFGYDSKGSLVTVTDATGNVTTIQRNPTEQPTAMVSPFGQTTMLAVDSHGFLSQVTDPLGKSETFVNSSTGLLLSRIDQNGNTFTYTYDGNGRLAKDADSLGGFMQLGRTIATSGMGWTVAETTSMGRTSSYHSTLTLPWIQDGTQPQSEQHLNIWPDGLQATSSKSLQNGQISESASLPDGTSSSTTLGPDPVWGLQVPVTTSQALAQGNLTMNITGSRTATLGTAGNPFSVSSETDTQTINGRTYTSAFSSSNRRWVSTSPVGRTLTVGLDSLERVASTQIAGLTATNLTYDPRGRLASTTQGPRKTTFSYGSDGFLASVIDPLNLTTSFGYDGDGHLQSSTLPDGRVITYTYDANGNLTSVTPPGKSAHDFAYNAVDLPSSYTPPAVTGTGATSYTYNLDRDLTTITRPDGEKINYGYDTAGRLISTGTPTGTTSFTYSSTTGNLATVSRAPEHIAYSYNGPLPTKTTWSGTVAGSVSRNYNDNFWVTAESVGGGSNIAFQHDNDGLLTAAGSLAVGHNAKNGLIAATKLGLASDSRTYNSFGELTGYTASVNGAAVYKVTYTRDADGRVSGKTETINGASNTYSYTYDLAGRLATATKNGANDTYTYDSNSNRLTAATSSGTVTGIYDAQDRLLSYGSASYTYTANGELASQTVGTQKTVYQYDVLGNLIAAALPNGTKLAYIIDGANRRMGKKVNGVLQTGFLFDGSRIVAQLNGSNQLVSQFVYATGSTSPDYMLSGGVTYRIFSDQLGSPVLVVNTSTGAIAEQITYDEFGNVLSDASPGFQPFGFAGGLYDQDTKLVRFGARDYNPSSGRWTSKDPILFNGGDTNLYGYVLDDPVNGIDPLGLDCDTCTDKAKEAGKKTIKMQLKVYVAKTPDAAAEAVQKGMQSETEHAALREYKMGQEEAKKTGECAKGTANKVEKLWIKSGNALAPGTNDF